MRLITVFVMLSAILSCKTPTFSLSMNHREAFNLYRNASLDNADWHLKYNADSTFVICIQGIELPGAEPLTFFVVDIHGKRKLFASQQEYHNVSWSDRQTLRLVKRTGIPKGTRDVTQPQPSPEIKYYNVRSNTLIENNSTNSIKP